MFTAYWALLGTVYTFMYVRYEVQGGMSARRDTLAALLGSVGTVDCARWGVQATVQPGRSAPSAARSAAARARRSLPTTTTPGGTSGDGDDKHPRRCANAPA